TSFFVPPGTDGTAFFMALNGRADGVELCLTLPLRLASAGRIERCLAHLTQAVLNAAHPSGQHHERNSP
ncbi:MAG: hypothetical protein AAB131_16995, partial [Actinomycetota bacterium]